MMLSLFMILEKIIALKIDVDTFFGMKHGSPLIASLLKDYGIRGSFFVPTGRDNTGRTAKRVFTRRGFLSKAKRVGVIRTYGIRTLLFGLLIPGPKIAERNREILKKILDEGHEVGIHGHDHVFWHDKIRRLNYKRTLEELEKAAKTYEDLLKTEPRSFASPGWVTNLHALKILEAKSFSYSSDTRGYAPFFPIMNGEVIRLLQIPTTLPTLDEVIGIHGNDPNSLISYYENLLNPSINVLTIHAEIEGRNWSEFLKIFIEKTLQKGYRYMRLIDIAYALEKDELPQIKVFYGTIEGRAGEVCIQEKPGKTALFS